MMHANEHETTRLDSWISSDTILQSRERAWTTRNDGQIECAPKKFFGIQNFDNPEFSCAIAPWRIISFCWERHMTEIRNLFVFRWI